MRISGLFIRRPVLTIARRGAPVRASNASIAASTAAAFDSIASNWNGSVSASHGWPRAAASRMNECQIARLQK